MTEPRASIERQRFETMYVGGAPPWDIGRPQPMFVAAADRVTGSLLDVGCGTGEHALLFASRGCKATGIDWLEEPIARARRKAAERGIAATFLVKDALTLAGWPERFDNALDSGLFHVFSDEDRVSYVRGLKTVLKPGGHLLLGCFSDKTPGSEGPRRISERDLRDAFRDGWEIERLESSEFEVRPEVKANMFAGGNPKAWFLLAKRLPSQT